ncbi:MAG: DUF1016 domain-containing protein [Candidatus Accumulibacter sp.]|nr:DUF1016 domain-containing protein [Accumulibacter sp.]
MLEFFENDLEKTLTTHIQKFLLELGRELESERRLIDREKALGQEAQADDE